MKSFPEHEGHGLTVVGVWLADTLFRAIPFVQLLPVRSGWREAKEVVVTFRRLQTPHVYRYKLVNWGDYYHPPDAPKLTVWRHMSLYGSRRWFPTEANFHRRCREEYEKRREA